MIITYFVSDVRPFHSIRLKRSPYFRDFARKIGVQNGAHCGNMSDISAKWNSTRHVRMCSEQHFLLARRDLTTPVDVSWSPVLVLSSDVLSRESGLPFVASPLVRTRVDPIGKNTLHLHSLHSLRWDKIITITVLAINNMEYKMFQEWGAHYFRNMVWSDADYSKLPLDCLYKHWDWIQKKPKILLS